MVSCKSLIKKESNYFYKKKGRFFVILGLILLISSNYIQYTHGADPRADVGYANLAPKTSLQRNLDAYGKGPFCASCHDMLYPQPPEELIIPAPSPKVYKTTTMEPGLKRLTDHPGRDVGAIYNPIGDKIIWKTDRLGNWTIWGMNSDGSEKRQLTSENTISGWPTWSPDGEEVVYWSWNLVSNTCDIWKMEVNGDPKIQLTLDGSFKGPPQWSPKGDRIAYTSNLTGNMEAYVMNIDGSESKKLTDGHNPNFWVESRVTWHPDGERLYYQVTTFPLPPNTSTIIPDDVAFVEIYVVNVDTGEQKNLTPNLHENVRSVSPDGKKLICISLRSPNYGLWVMDNDGNNQIPLTWDGAERDIQPNVGDRAPHISPDGKKIVYWSLKASEQSDIWMINIDGSNQTRLTSNLYKDIYPTWSPDGEKIIFESDRTGNFDIWQLSLDRSIVVNAEFENILVKGSNDKAIVTIEQSKDYNSLIKIEKIGIHFNWDSENAYVEQTFETPPILSKLDDALRTELEFSIPEDASLGYHYYDIKIQYGEVISGEEDSIKSYEHTSGDAEVGTFEQRQCDILYKEINTELEQLHNEAISRSFSVGQFPSETSEPLMGYFSFLTEPETDYYVKANDDFLKAKNLYIYGDYDNALVLFQEIKALLNEASK
ncbi:MAG: DUF5050 domain-containing protein [Candidatus Bathyarchaeota archaeon]|nr:DUF5050 domain-containing protein [Candidatus Bathyarchaeota archaeon]